MRFRFLIFFVIGTGLAACDSDNDSGPRYHGQKAELAEISDSQCLNLEKYFAVLRSMPPGLPVRHLTTDFEAQALKDNYISENFRVRAGYQNFFIEDTQMSKISFLRPVKQPDCSQVILTAGNTEQTYTVAAKGPGYITLESEWDERFTYRWLSPTAMQIEQEYRNGDLNCHDKSHAVLKVTRELHWGNAAEVRGGTLPRGKIAESYIDLLTEATGVPKADLVAGAGPATEPAFLTEIPPSPTPPPSEPQPELDPPVAPTPAPSPEEPAPRPEEPAPPPVPQPEPQPDAPLSVRKIRQMLEQPIRPELLRCD